jgi:hypothetical protein
MGSFAGAPKARLLTGWKEIARYMGKGVRTIQRWERDFGLPVRRPLSGNRRPVLARPGDLDRWVAIRCRTKAPDADRQSERAEMVRVWTELRERIERGQNLCNESSRCRMELQSAIAGLRQQISDMHPSSRLHTVSAPETTESLAS